MKAKRLKTLRAKYLRKDPARLADILEKDLARRESGVSMRGTTPIKPSAPARIGKPSTKLLHPKRETGVTIQRKAKKHWTDESDDAYDKAHHIKEGSPRDLALDKRRGVPEDDKKTRKAKKMPRRIKSDRRKGGALADSQGTGMEFKRRKSHKTAPRVKKVPAIRGIVIALHRKVKKARLDAEDRREMKAGTYNAREEAAEQKPIHVKKGALHQELGIPQGQKIPMGTLEKAKHSKNPLLRKRANFAINFGHKAHKSTPAYKHVVDNKMKAYGETDHAKRVVRINKKKNRKSGRGEMIDTMAHEEMHVKHPMMKEKTVRKRTEKAVKRMSLKQKNKLYGMY